jgi:hypothetical protein
LLNVAAATGQVTLNELQGLPAGMYLLRFTLAETTQNLKVVKQ